MYSIGEFSKITGLTVKALHFYHDEGLIVPAYIDPHSGYRNYDPGQIETARAIAFLRSLDFPIGEIKEILKSTEGGDILAFMERHKYVLEGKIKQFKKAVRLLDQFITEERQAKNMARIVTDIQEKTLTPALVAGIRMKGKYSDCGKAFAKLGRSFGWSINGKPFLLHYDSEYKEDDADFEAVMPIRKSKTVDGVSVRELPGGKCVALLHNGPYDKLGHSYAKILKYVKEKGYRIAKPTREVYLKGPGMIFRGNPKNYLTEIQMAVEAAG